MLRLALLLHAPAHPPAPQLTDVGGLALCRAAKAALMLQRLNLSLNPGITSATMMGLADAVRGRGAERKMGRTQAGMEMEGGCRVGRPAWPSHSLDRTPLSELIERA